MRSKVILFMKSTSSGGVRQGGFTLIEIIVVLTVIGALLAAMAPMAFEYLNDARQAQAQNDVNQIATAIGRFMQSTGLPPYKNNTTTDKIPAWVSPDFTCLVGSQGNAFTAAEDSTAGDSWSGCFIATSTADDTIENHLITNTPGGTSTKAYKTTGRNKWEGPYLPSVAPDPWGNAYLVNIGQTDPADSPPQAAWAISAGANGLLETAFAQNAATSITASGDDIIARVK